MIHIKYSQELAQTKKYHKIRYYSRNGEEQILIYFDDIIIDISIEFSNIDLVIIYKNNRCNYANSLFIPDSMKDKINVIFSRKSDTKSKLKQLDMVLLELSSIMKNVSY